MENSVVHFHRLASPLSGLHMWSASAPGGGGGGGGTAPLLLPMHLLLMFPIIGDLPAGGRCVKFAPTNAMHPASNM